MNREIIFRAKRVDNGEWVYGSYHYCNKEGTMRYEKWAEGNLIHKDRSTQFNCHWILSHITPDSRGWDVKDTFSAYKVIPETVGQLLPLKDANGSNVFEGDIVKGERTPDNPMTSYLDISPAAKRAEYRVVMFVLTDDSIELYLPKSISYSERLPHNYIHWVVVGNIFDTPELMPENG